MITNKRIFITGGAGFLGKNMIQRYYDDNQITIYSRDEAKHYYIKKQFPKIKCIIGDIADFDSLKRASKNHDIGIFAASLKQIEAIDENYEMGVRTIINGAINSRRCAEENNFQSACFISSDKSRAATTLYGSMKFVAGESFIVNDENSSVNLTTAIYGNVMNSTGSVIPLILDSIRKKYSIFLYSPEMTRFMLSIDEAISVIETALNMNISGYNIIPKAKSFSIKDLFEIYMHEFSLMYTITKPRISEKIHEIMISNEEVPRITMMNTNKYYFMHHRQVFNEVVFVNNEYSSRDNLITKEELYDYLKQNDFYIKK
jgi:UDP-N-acetylglucosamine 4,6-dehydratase